MTQNLITTVFRKEVLNLSAYKVAEAKNLIKLDARKTLIHGLTTSNSNGLKQLKIPPLIATQTLKPNNLLKPLEKPMKSPLKARFY